VKKNELGLMPQSLNQQRKKAPETDLGSPFSIFGEFENRTSLIRSQVPRRTRCVVDGEQIFFA